MDNLGKEKNLEQKIESRAESGKVEFAQENQELKSREIKEQKEKRERKKIPEELWKPQGAATVGSPGIDTKDSPLHQNIESILEHDLEDLYFSMSPQEQERFKRKGEQTTSQIVKLVQTGKATFKKIFKLIFGWLKFIPGVNKYFLEQEAKIKADRILNIKE